MLSWRLTRLAGVLGAALIGAGPADAFEIDTGPAFRNRLRSPSALRRLGRLRHPCPGGEDRRSPALRRSGRSAALTSVRSSTRWKWMTRKSASLAAKPSSNGLSWAAEALRPECPVLSRSSAPGKIKMRTFRVGAYVFKTL
jgi:hypothetical protein